MLIIGMLISYKLIVIIGTYTKVLPKNIYKTNNLYIKKTNEGKASRKVLP